MEGGSKQIARDKRFYSKSRTPATRVNERIRASQLRLVGEDGSQLGIVSLVDARKMAEEKGIDLVEVAPNAEPPVCRLMDYGKFKYETKKQASLKKQKVVGLKEVTFRPNIGAHDLDFKVNNIKGFLEKGHQTKVRIFFRGREITHPEIGRGLIERITEQVSEIATVYMAPKIEGKNMIAIFAPKKKTGGKENAKDQNK